MQIIPSSCTHICNMQIAFAPPSHALVVITCMERGGMLLHDAVGMNCKKGATTENQTRLSNIWTKGCILMTVCVCFTWLDMTTPPWWGRKSCYTIITNHNMKIVQLVYNPHVPKHVLCKVYMIQLSCINPYRLRAYGVIPCTNNNDIYIH